MWVNASVQCNMYNLDCAMWVNAIITDGTEPVWTLKPHGTNQLKLASKAKHELHQGKISGVQTELGRARTGET